MFLSLIDQSGSITVLPTFDIQSYHAVSPFLDLMQALINLKPIVNVFVMLPKKAEVTQIIRLKMRTFGLQDS